jgi:hypothetical protein
VKIRVNPWLNSFRVLVAGLIVVAFCLLLLWRDPLVFWNDDYELSVLPVFADVARSWNEGHWPLLSPYSWVCNNLAGEFEYGTFSIFVNAAVVLIWKFPLTFPQQSAALSTTHLFVLSAGAFLLARNRNVSVPLAMFVTLIAALNGWIICWGASDWFGALAAFAWLPWAWWALERAMAQFPPDDTSAGTTGKTPMSRRLDPKRVMMRALFPAPFVYLVVTGGFPYTVVMLVLLIVWLSIKSLVQTKSLMSILPMLVGVALGFGMSAPAYLAIIEYIHGSAREAQPAAMHWQWIVPWRALPGFILPCWTVNWADFSARYVPRTARELACGLAAPAALATGFLNRARMLVRQIKWEFFLLLLVLLLSMIPTVSVFRWSFRWLPLFHLTLALCAAEVLGRSYAPDMSPPEKAVTRYRTPKILTAEALQPLPRLATPGTAALLLVGVTAIAMSILHTGGAYAFPLTWIFLAIATGWTIGEFLSPNESLRAWLPAGVTFAALLATYFCIPPNGGVPKYNLDQKLLEPAPLDPQRLYLSVYPAPEWNYRVEAKPQPIGQVVRPGSTSMWAGLRFVNGYSPIRPAGVAREFSFAVHGEIDPSVGESLLRDKSGALAELGIDGIVVAKGVTVEPPPMEWQLVFANEEGRVFHRTGGPLAQVRSVNWIDSLPNQKFANATISRIDDSRQRVAADVDVPPGDKPALVKFSRPYFRGYIARIGETKLAVESYRGLIPVVKVPAGSHGRLTLTYRPWWLTSGSAVAVVSGIVFAVGLVGALRNRISAGA